MSSPKRDPRLLLSPIFLIALSTLILNDQIWKYTYGNLLTGKLSDFSGLILLPLVLAFLFPAWRKGTVWFSALFFLFWKTPWSTPFIDWYNLIAPIPISRVVDYSDYLALFILPLPYWMIQRFAQAPTHTSAHWQPLASWSVLLVTSLSFIATQPPPRLFFQYSSGNVSFYDCKFKIDMTRAEVLQKLANQGLVVEVDTALAGNIRMRNFVYSDSILANDPPFYRIPQFAVEGDTLYEIQFSLRPQAKEKVILYLNGLQVDDIPVDQLTRKLRRMYRKTLKKELVERSSR
ncbi:MAG: hypothetical protein AAFZ63_21670 [Bacteroidota bacterium]